MKRPDKELTPIRKALATFGPVVGAGVPAYWAPWLDWTPTFAITAVGLGVGYSTSRC